MNLSKIGARLNERGVAKHAKGNGTSNFGQAIDIGCNEGSFCGNSEKITLLLISHHLIKILSVWQ